MNAVLGKQEFYGQGGSRVNGLQRGLELKGVDTLVGLRDAGEVVCSRRELLGAGGRDDRRAVVLRLAACHDLSRHKRAPIERGPSESVPHMLAPIHHATLS